MATGIEAAGIDLKVARVKAGAKQTDIARHMGVSASRIAQLEKQSVVPPASAGRYFDALEAFIADTPKKPTHKVVLVPEITRVDPVAQYTTAKAEARAMARAEKWVKTVELRLTETTPAAQMLGWLDGFEASGVSCTVLDASGRIVNRRIG